MTKAELVEDLKRKEERIKDLESEIESMHKDRIALDTIVTNEQTSVLIASLNARIKELEETISKIQK